MYVHDNKIHFVGDFFAAFHKCCRSLTNTVYESKVVCIIGIFFFYLGIENFKAGVRVMVLNTTFNNISVISWQSVLLEETGGNHRPAASH
jgi:hypothetical protein